MQKNKLTTYLLYAIGEIVLVVIGILIAFQIDQLKQENMLKNEQKSILENLNEEFLGNKKELNRTQKSETAAFQAGMELMTLINVPEDEVDLKRVDSLLFVLLNHSIYSQSENALNDLQSGRLRILKNKQLKDLLNKWTRLMKSKDEVYLGLDKHIENIMIPYLYKHYAFKDIDQYGELGWEEGTKLKVDKMDIFKDIEFENILDDLLYRNQIYINKLDETEVLIERIVLETKPI